ncbi:DUF929 family protein [Flexivirga oryzae]|uniref:Thiol-disulfide isomerase/thioredoxin n=1 Tax=Flexivirga oryzae TaxID=1794944 RepID=A0A839N270_9MICO|nr:DUF929 family protein [Flexivirga oryzae]MBB2890889.1 thiol-disulfide isomerase/thioredoxin [Flexivirga oryzae]
MASPTGREKLAALQAQQARAARQKKLLAITSGAVVIVLAAVAIFFIVGQKKADSDNKKAVSAASDAAYIDALLTIPTTTYDAVGHGSASTAPKAINGAALTKAGKPEVLYMGAEFCPYCGMERWALTAALSRFGTFTGLKSAVSTANDNPANIPTLTYLHAKYTSKYLTFTTYEMADRAGNKLQTPDKASTALFSKYDSGGSIPFIDYGNKAVSVGATFQGASYMQNVSGADVAAKLKDPTSTEAKGILGAANVITAHLCDLTKGKPAAVCASKGVIQAASGV